MGKMLIDATKGCSLSDSSGGNICFRCDSRLTGAVVNRKDTVKANTLYK